MIFNALIKLSIQIKIKKNNLIQNENVFKVYNFSSLTDSYNDAKDFIHKNINSILIHNKNLFKSNENPLVSVVIPVYNTQDLINNTIKSIQNQDLLNIEIVLINDFSTDNSLNIIKRLQKEDPRIKIINNKKNMGIFYSRNIGTLSSRGEFIFPLDNDDMILNKDVLSTITNIAKEGNFDIVEFKGVEIWRNDFNDLKSNIKNTNFSEHKLNLVLFQPELSAFPIQPGRTINNYNLNSCYLWAKCIRKNIYKKGLNYIGKNKYSRYIRAWEDLISMIILFNTANSYKFVGKYGILRIKRRGSGFFVTKTIEKKFAILYLVDTVLDFPKNTPEYKRLITNLIYVVLNSNLIKKIIRIRLINYETMINIWLKQSIQILICYIIQFFF